MVAAPFVRFFGLNGLLLLHVLLLAAAGVAAYVFLSAQSSPLAAATFVSAFLGASVMPVYGVFLMPEIFNFTLVTLAYFFWLYKEVAPASRLARPWTDIVAAVLLGIGTYSKPIPVAVLVAPLVLLAWMRKRWQHGFVLGVVAIAVAVCVVFVQRRWSPVSSITRVAIGSISRCVFRSRRRKAPGSRSADR